MGSEYGMSGVREQRSAKNLKSYENQLIYEMFEFKLLIKEVGSRVLCANSVKNFEVENG